MKSSGFLVFLFAGVCLFGSSVEGQRRRGGPPSAIYGRNRNVGQQQHISDDDDEGTQQVSMDNEEDFLNIIQSSAYTDSSSPEAATPKGTFHGLKETVNGKDVYIFRGIPYAKPPVGPLRFKRPIMADKLDEPFEATTLPNACPQTVAHVFPEFSGEQMWTPNTNMSEDCLYINIWVPAKVFEEKENSQVPVLFWIYGGGFFSGSNSLDVYDGALLAVNQDLIVVSPQYRLGPLGFLYFGTDDAPGNMGLVDQALALQWTRDNIEYFGGNPNLLTAAGESAGSAAVGLHLVSPISKSYLKRGIMMSGLPDASYAWNTPEQLKSQSFALAKNAGCEQKDVSQVIDCLRKLDSDKFVALQWKNYKHMMGFPFTPTTDGYFLTGKPEDVIKRGKAKRADLMIGTVQDEGTYFILYHYINYLSHVKSTSIPYDRFVDMMNELFHDYSEAQREAIISEYTHWENPEDGLANLHNLGEAVGDNWFICKNRIFADNWSNRGLSVYYYHITERVSANPWAKWMGVMHGDDVPILFGAALKSNDSWTVGEQQMTINFMRMVGDFVKTGVPSPKWERYTSEHPVYLELNATTITDASSPDRLGPKANECAFWNKILPLVKSNEEDKCKKMGRGSRFGGRNQGQRPQWNTMGQGVHGGQGFFVDDLHHHHRCPMYQSYHGCSSSDFGSNSPTETSCRCSVEEGPTSTQEEEVEWSTPRPAFN